MAADLCMPRTACLWFLLLSGSASSFAPNRAFRRGAIGYAPRSPSAVVVDNEKSDTTTLPPLDEQPALDALPAARKAAKLPVSRYHKSWQWTPKASSGPSRTYRINYRVEGPADGKPILLTHGFGASISHFRYNIPALVEAGYKVYAMDLLGFGASEKPSNAASVGFSIELFTQQIIDFVASRSEDAGQAWVLAGNSIGGLCSLAVAAAANDPDKPDVDVPFEIAALVLFNSAGGMTGFRYSDVPLWAHPIMAYFQYFLLGPVHGPFLYNVVSQRQTVETVLKQGGIYQDTTNLDDELLDMLLEPAQDPNARGVFLAVFSGPAGPSRESLLPHVKVPVLALWGEDDTFTPFDDDVKALPKLHGTKDFTLDSIPNAGHCLHDEHPELVNAKMLDFLSARVSE